MHRLEVSHDLSHTHRSGGLDQWVEQACGHQFVSHFDRLDISEGIKPITLTFSGSRLDHLTEHRYECRCSALSPGPDPIAQDPNFN